MPPRRGPGPGRRRPVRSRSPALYRQDRRRYRPNSRHPMQPARTRYTTDGSRMPVRVPLLVPVAMAPGAWWSLSVPRSSSVPRSLSVPRSSWSSRVRSRWPRPWCRPTRRMPAASRRARPRRTCELPASLGAPIRPAGDRLPSTGGTLPTVPGPVQWVRRESDRCARVRPDGRRPDWGPTGWDSVSALVIEGGGSNGGSNPHWTTYVPTSESRSLRRRTAVVPCVREPQIRPVSRTTATDHRRSGPRGGRGHRTWIVSRGVV